MKKRFITLILLAVGCTVTHAQNYSIQQLHATQQFYLNSTTRTDFGHGDNTTYLAVELPPNTKEWYYSFSATQEKSNKSLNLFPQLLDLFDQSGTLSMVMESIVVPEGNARTNIRVTDFDNAMKFNNGEAYHYFPDFSRENYTEGVVKVTQGTAETVYLCFENPNSLDGISLNIEVSAMVGDKSEGEQALEDLGESIDDFIEAIKENKQAKIENQKKANEWLNYSNTGWVLFESGQYEQSMIYTQKAQEIANHPGLCFNMGIAKWAKDSTDCLPDYLEGLNMLYDLSSKEEAVELLESALSDIETAEEKIEGFKRHEATYAVVKHKLGEIQTIENWKRKR